MASNVMSEPFTREKIPADIAKLSRTKLRFLSQRTPFPNLSQYSRTRIKETFEYKKRFHSSTFRQDKLSMLIGQLIKETMDKKNSFLTAL